MCVVVGVIPIEYVECNTVRAPLYCATVLLQGIWKALEQELGRPSNNIGNRYRKLVKTYASAASEDGAPLLPGTNVDNYMEVSSERKLAAVLAPVGGSMGSADLSDAAVREAAITAAMLAGKRRGRPRTNPLPLSLDGKMTHRFPLSLFLYLSLTILMLQCWRA